MVAPARSDRAQEERETATMMMMMMLMKYSSVLETMASERRTVSTPVSCLRRSCSVVAMQLVLMLKFKPQIQQNFVETKRLKQNAESAFTRLFSVCFL